MWFGPQDGLHKYDGYTFTVYRHDADTPQSLSNNFVLSIYEDSSGVLWIGSWGALSQLERQDAKFHPFAQQLSQLASTYQNDELLAFIRQYRGETP
jgi:ligand-binding sensor domain-containing protein